jgi:hypothetical protein
MGNVNIKLINRIFACSTWRATIFTSVTLIFLNPLSKSKA